MLRGAVLAASLLCAPGAAHAELGRDDQWVYVPAAADHGERAELRGDSGAGPATELIVQIECMRAERVLEFRFDAWDGLPAEELDRPLALLLGDSGELILRMPTTRSGMRLIGRLTLTPQSVAAIRDASYVMIDAPNDMGEVFHGGGAPALKRVAQECWERTVG